MFDILFLSNIFAADMPAIPAPTTITSQLNILLFDKK